MAECNQLSCPDPATHTVHWPGGSKTMCDRHAQIAIDLARSMGFEVTTERLAPPADTVTLPASAARDLHNELTKRGWFCTGDCAICVALKERR